MADEIRPPRGAATGERSGPDPGATRAQIEATRPRMSETNDEIEEALIREREEIHDRLDFLAWVRERPLRVLGAVFAAGLMLGFLNGGDEDEEERERIDPARIAWERADSWEARARRLRRIARDQEAEIQRLRALVRASGRYAEIEDEAAPTRRRVRG